MAEFADYVAVLDRMPTNAAGIAESSWTVSILPTGSVVATKRVPVSHDHVALGLHDELERLLRECDPTSHILHSRVAPAEGGEAPPDDAARLFQPETSYIVNPAGNVHIPIYDPAPAPSSDTPQDSTAKKTASTNGDAKQSEATPSPAGEDAQLIEKGLPALDVPEKLWDYIDVKKRPDLAEKTVTRLYDARVAYAARASWEVAPELELLDLVDRPLDDPTRTVKRTKAGELLEVRIKLAEAEANLSREEVFLKQELIKQQAIVTVILAEALKQSVAWRDLAKTGKRVLLVLTLFAAVIVGLLTHLLFGTNRLDPWAYSVAIFALAVFALSPAALLIIERPLKGIDEWTPTAKPDSSQAQQSQNGGAASGATSQSSTSGKTGSAK